jgi:hypothetical protein
MAFETAVVTVGDRLSHPLRPVTGEHIWGAGRGGAVGGFYSHLRRFDEMLAEIP